jgi:hypothetical protein
VLFHLFVARVQILYACLCIWRILSVFDPVHISAIQLCTGTCRTSRVESLHAESGEPALITHWKILLCMYAAKLSTLKKHSSNNRAVHHPSLQIRFAFNPKSSRSACIRFKELLDLLHISTLPIILPKIPTTPPCHRWFPLQHPPLQLFNGMYTSRYLTDALYSNVHRCCRLCSCSYRWVSSEWMSRFCFYFKWELF